MTCFLEGWGFEPMRIVTSVLVDVSMVGLFSVYDSLLLYTGAV